MRDLHEGILLEFAERVVRFDEACATDAGLTFRMPNLDSRETEKSRMAFRRAAKLCEKCGLPAIGTLCAEHKAKHAARTKARYAGRKLLGLCRDCPNQASGGVRCDECVSKRKAAA
jgi:hypothetical protein